MLRQFWVVLLLFGGAGWLVAQAEFNGQSFVYELMPLWPDHEHAQSLVAAVDQGNSVVMYQVTFDAEWSVATHPDQFPPNPHFSGLIGGTHHGPITFWETGGLASPGMKNMAETGSKFPLNQEINETINGGSAGFLLSGGGVGISPGLVNLVFQINRRFPRVTLVTMIAPSPDWFLGVSGVSLYGENGWKQEVVVDLLPYDAGTDSGPLFLSPDQPTIPAETIFAINEAPFLNGQALPRLGTFTFTRIDP